MNFKKLIFLSSIIVSSNIYCADETIFEDPINKLSLQFNSIIDTYYEESQSYNDLTNTTINQETVENSKMQKFHKREMTSCICLLKKKLRQMSTKKKQDLVTNYVNLYYRLIMLENGVLNQFFTELD